MDSSAEEIVMDKDTVMVGVLTKEEFATGTLTQTIDTVLRSVSSGMLTPTEGSTILYQVQDDRENGGPHRESVALKSHQSYEFEQRAFNLLEPLARSMVESLVLDAGGSKRDIAKVRGIREVHPHPNNIVPCSHCGAEIQLGDVGHGHNVCDITAPGPQRS